MSSEDITSDGDNMEPSPQSRFWRIDALRSLTFANLPSKAQLKFANVDRAAFRSFVACAYRSIHFETYSSLPLAFISKQRLDLYLNAVHFLDVTGYTPALGANFDLIDLADTFPSVRTIKWSSGVLDIERPRGGGPRYHCVLDVVIIWHKSTVKCRPGLMNTTPDVMPRLSSSCNVHLYDTAAVRADLDLERMLQATSEALTDHDIRKLVIDADWTIPDDIHKVLAGLRPQIGGLRYLDIRRYRASNVCLPQHHWLQELPSTCETLLLQGPPGVTIDGMLSLGFENQHKSLSSLRHLVLETSSLAKGRIPIPATYGGGEVERLLQFKCANGRVSPVPLPQLQKLDLSIYLGGRSTEWIHWCFESRALPPMFMMASRMLALGGQACEYSLTIKDRQDRPVSRAFSGMQNRLLKQEVASIIHEQNRSAVPGWSRLEKSSAMSKEISKRRVSETAASGCETEAHTTITATEQPVLQVKKRKVRSVSPESGSAQ